MVTVRVTVCALSLFGCASHDVMLGLRCAPEDIGCRRAEAGLSDAFLDGGVAVFADATCEGCDSSVDASLCVPGTYAGSDRFSWTPTAAGVCFLTTIFGGSGGGRMAMNLDLDFSADPHTPRATGCMESFSDTTLAKLLDGGAEQPLRMQFTGTMNCETGQLSIYVKGTYRTGSFCDLNAIPRDYFFRGPATARFDPSTRSFVEGTGDYREPPVVFGNPGGNGTWTAALLDANASDGGFLVLSPEDCLGGVTFRDDLFEAAPP